MGDDDGTMVAFLIVEFRSLVVENPTRGYDQLIRDQDNINYVALLEMKSDYEILLAIDIRDLN